MPIGNYVCGNFHTDNGKGDCAMTTYPSNTTQGGGHSTGGGSVTNRSSHSSPEQHIQQVCTSLGGNVLGGSYHDGRKNRDSADGINYQVKGIVSQLNYYGFKDPKGIVLSDCALEDKDTYALHQTLQYYPLNLTVLDLSNNCLGLNSVHTIFYSLRGAQQGDTNYLCKQIKSINLSNNWLGDDSALFISQALEYGNVPNLKYINVSGNNMSWESNALFAKASNNLRQDIKILINKVIPIDSIVGGVKKQSDLFFGSKEEKHAVIKDYLKHAQSNGVDVQNVAVSKSIFETIKSSVKLYFNYQVGFAKCNIVPEDATSFAAGAIVAKISKKATGVMTVTDAVACYFEVFDESASSQEGVQFMLDAGIVTTTDLLGNVE
jgi:hypothetical protein